MNILEVLRTYVHYLIHPFKTHEQFLYPDRFEGELPDYSSYQSLSISWVFVVFNGIGRVVLLNLVLVMMVGLLAETELSSVVNIGEIPSLYLIILSTVLDVIFFPLFGFFIIQFWDIVIRAVGFLLETPGNLALKADRIISVYFSANIFRVIPVLGGPIKSFAGMLLLYAGLRKQLNASPLLAACVVLTPMLFILVVVSMIMLLVLLSL